MTEREKTFLDDLTEEQRNEVWQLLVYTIKEMREELAIEMENTAAMWKMEGKLKSRKTLRAFQECIDITRGVKVVD